MASTTVRDDITPKEVCCLRCAVLSLVCWCADLISGFVSCNHAGLIPEGRRIRTVRLRMRPSRVFGRNPFVNGTQMQVDMVCCCIPCYAHIHGDGD